MEDIPEEKENTSGFDIKRLFMKLARNYPVFLLVIPAFIAGAWLYLHYTIPLYQVVTFIQIQLPNDADNMLGGSPFNSQGSARGKEMPDMNSEIFKLQSASLIGEAVDSLNLAVAVTKPGRVRNLPVLADSLPFLITVGRTFPDKTSVLYGLELADSGYKLINEKNRISGIYGQDLLVGGDTVNLQLKDSTGKKSHTAWSIRFLGRAGTIASYASRLIVAPVVKGGAGMLQLSAVNEIPQRGKKFIDVLIYRYDLANLDFKNKRLSMEMQFLEGRLATVNRELETQENYVRDFKTNNKINDVSSAANQLLTSLSSIDSKKSDNIYKESLLDLVESQAHSGEGQEERINAPGLQDADIVGLITRYNDLVSQKKKIVSQGAPLDPRLPSLNSQLSEMKTSISSRLRSTREEVRTNNDFLKSQERDASGIFQGLPEKEKDYIQVNRLLNIKQALYVFLLQRKEDKDIEFASAGIRGSRIIDSRINGKAKEPDPTLIYGIALAAALLIPSLVLLLRMLLNRRIESWQDIQQSTNLPVTGEIAYENDNKKGLLTTGSRMPVIEQFRTLRTNISYIGSGMPQKTLLVTSGISGEGKSFISLNLANTLAMGNKKVALLEFDLRNPNLSERMGFEKMAGIANYLSGDADIAEIIFPVQGCRNLYFLCSGYPIPEDPGEIILSDRMEDLFEYLKQHFDFIIMDTPPIEAVSDALTLGKYADSSLFVVRHKYSFRSSLSMVNQLKEEGKLPNPTLIINGIRPGYGFRSTNGYGYGYEYKGKSRQPS
jgi:tyrosine-protein kinase Etk/Wzc